MFVIVIYNPYTLKWKIIGPYEVDGGQVAKDISRLRIRRDQLQMNWIEIHPVLMDPLTTTLEHALTDL